MEKTEKSNTPQKWKENRAAAGFRKADFHLYMSFFKVSDQIDLLIGSTSDKLTGNIRAHISIFKNTDKKFLTVLWIIVNPGVNVLWEAKIDPAGLQNNLIKMTDAGILAPVMYLVEINFICMPPEVKGKITQQTDTETTVQIMLQHMMDHIKNIFRRRQNGVGKIIDRL